MRGIPALYDLDVRLKVVDQFPDYTQVLGLPMPPIDRLVGPDKSPEMAKLANDGLAEVVAKHPDRFVGYSAVVPMNAPEAAAKEAERALKNGAQRGAARHQRQRQADRRPEFWPLYEMIEKSGKPILLHPGAQPRDDRLPGRGEIEIRDLQRARLAVRDRRRAVALHLLQDHGHLSRI